MDFVGWLAMMLPLLTVILLVLVAGSIVLVAGYGLYERYFTKRKAATLKPAKGASK